jgi:kynurenine formamidase
MRRIAVGVLAGALAVFTVSSVGTGSSDAPGDNRAPALAAGTLVDLTYQFNARTLYWPTATRFKLTRVAHGMTQGGFFYAANDFEAAEHGGTHVDAPIHFSRTGQTAEEMPLRRFIGNGVVIDVSSRALRNRDYQVSVRDLLAWERRNGKIARNSIVFLRTGFGKFYPNAAKYLGTADRGADAVPKLHFPGLHASGTRWLVRNRAIKAIGIDTASIDYGQSQLFPTHRILAANQIPLFENVANLHRLPAKGFTVIALPMKIDEGTGGPTRIVAVIGALPGGGRLAGGAG